MRKPIPGKFLAIFFIAVIIAAASCKKSTDNTVIVPVVGTTSIVSEVTSTTAISGGIVYSTETISANGVCWSSTNQTPTIADSKTTDSISTNFTSKITGLTPGTVYYLRAYATGSAGTGYGGVVKLTTGSAASSRTVTVSTLAGSNAGAFGYQDGTGTGALFNGPQSIVYNANKGSLYVSDSFNNLIRTVTPAGVTGTLTNPALGYLDGPLASAQFYGPKGMAVDAQGNTFVADLGNNRIRKITAQGVVSTLAGNGVAGYADGTTPSIIEFNAPQGVAVDAQGNVYVADRANNIIRKITSAGVVSTLAGITVAGFFDGGAYDPTTGAGARFNYPAAVAVDPQGNIYVADLKNLAIREITPTGTVTTIAGGNNYKTLIGSPTGIAIDAQGNIFIVDQAGRVLEITASKVLYLIAGSATASGYVDGAGTEARFNSPQGITLDNQGNLYVADFGNNVIRKIVLKVVQ